MKKVINVHKKFWLSLNIFQQRQREGCNPATKPLKYEEQSLHREMCFQNIMPSQIILQILFQNSAFSDSFRLITWWIWVKKRASVGEESIMTWYEVSPKRLMCQRRGPHLVQPIIERALAGEHFALLRDHWPVHNEVLEDRGYCWRRSHWGHILGVIESPWPVSALTPSSLLPSHSEASSFALHLVLWCLTSSQAPDMAVYLYHKKTERERRVWKWWEPPGPPEKSGYDLLCYALPFQPKMQVCPTIEDIWLGSLCLINPILDLWRKSVSFCVAQDGLALTILRP